MVHNKIESMLVKARERVATRKLAVKLINAGYKKMVSETVRPCDRDDPKSEQIARLNAVRKFLKGAI